MKQLLLAVFFACGLLLPYPLAQKAFTFEKYLKIRLRQGVCQKTAKLPGITGFVTAAVVSDLPPKNAEKKDKKS